ncbi:MAG: hypothetical protein ABSF81_03865 [Bacteroidales bacterium]|jgi:hypothetical protein
MNGLEFLDLVIGLIFIFLIYSIACSTLLEIVISASQLRGKMLFTWIIENFSQNGSNLSKEIIDHPMIKGLSQKSNKKPTYISSGVFTDVLLDIVNNESNAGSSAVTSYKIDDLKKSIEDSKMLDSGLKRVFLQYISEASGNLQMVKDRIAKWFDEAQERLIGSFKKKVQLWIFIFSLIIVGITNADTIKLASYLYDNDSAREAIAMKASLFVQDSAVVHLISKIDSTTIASVANKKPDENVKKMGKDFNKIKELDQELKQAGIPLGWSKEKMQGFWDYVKKIGGLLLTTFAVSVGSPFWFDILSKLANLRAAGTKPKTILEEESGNKN